MFRRTTLLHIVHRASLRRISPHDPFVLPYRTSVPKQAIWLATVYEAGKSGYSFSSGRVSYHANGDAAFLGSAATCMHLALSVLRLV